MDITEADIQAERERQQKIRDIAIVAKDEQTTNLRYELKRTGFDVTMSYNSYQESISIHATREIRHNQVLKDFSIPSYIFGRIAEYGYSIYSLNVTNDDQQAKVIVSLLLTKNMKEKKAGGVK